MHCRPQSQQLSCVVDVNCPLIIKFLEVNYKISETVIIPDIFRYISFPHVHDDVKHKARNVPL